MKILILSDEYLPLVTPCSIRMSIIVNELKQNHTIKVLTSKYSYSNNEDDIFALWTTKVVKKNNIYRFFNNFILGMSAFFYIIKNNDFDLLILTSPPLITSFFAAAACKFVHKKYICDLRDIWPDVAKEMGKMKDSSLMFKIFNTLAHFIYERASLITCVTKLKKTKMELKGYDKVYYIPNGIDENILNTKLINTNMINNEKMSITYIGNVGLAQNLEIFLDLAMLNKNINFYIIGNGADKDRLIKISKQKNINNIIFHERVSHQTAVNLYRESTITFVSLLNSELKDSVPTKIFESIALGTPVFLIAEGESVEIIKNSKLGIFVSPNNTIEYINKKLNQLISTKFTRKDVSFARKYLLDNYSRQVAAKKLNEIIENNF